MGYTIRKYELKNGLKCPPYRSNTSLYTIELHHGGYFEWGKEIKYKNGTVSYIDFCHASLMSVDVLYEIFQKLGLWSVKKIYYKKVGDKFNYGLKQITDDNQVMYLEKNVDEFRIVEVYTESPSNNVNEPMVEGYDSDSDSDDSDFEIGKNSGVGDDSDLETFEGSDEEVGLDDEELLRSENVVLEGSKKVVPNEELCYGVADETEVDVLNQGFIESDGDNSLNSYDSDDSNAGVSKELAFTRVDLKKVTFKVGMKFVNADELKGAVTVYGIQEGKNIKNKRISRDKAKGKPSRKGMKMSCRNCGQVGHNLRGCLMPKVTNEKGSVSGSKRKKLSESTNETARNDEGLGDGQNVNECEQDAGNVTNMDDGLRDVPVSGDEFYDEEFWTQIACEDSLWNLGSQSKEHDSQLPTMTSLDSQLGKKVMSDNSQVPNMIKKDAVSSKGKNVMPITDMTAKSNDNMTSFDPVSSKGKSVVMSEADMNVNSKISAKIVGKTATIKKVIGKQPLKKLTVRRSSRIMNVIPKGPPKVSHIDLTGEDDEEDNGPLPTQESVNQMEMQTDSLVDILATPAATSSKSVEPPSSLHAGIMQPLPPALPKGQLLFKGRMYTTLAGLKNSSSATRVEEIEKMKKKSHDDMLNELYEELKNRDGEEEAGEKAKQP